MATLAINRNSISLNLESDHLVIHRHVIDGDEPERETLPVKDIDRVLIVGRPAISFSVLVRLMDCGIPCCFMTRGGRWRGILKSGLSHNGARRRLQSGKWFGLYYGSWLMYLGKADQAREYFRSVVRANLREAWSWLYLGRSYKGERERQRTCYCQALCCPVRDPTIGEGLAKKIHADLVSIGFNLKDRTEEVKTHAAGAEKLLCDGVTALWVEGVLERRDGWPHGFVRMGSTSVFVSPPVIGKYRLNAGDPIRGIAEKSFDKKKGCDGWTLKSILRQV